MDNPYNPLQPTDDPTHFYGREEVFAFFRQQLVGTAHDRALVLIGRRGLGKSAVLRQLHYQIDEHYIPCIVNLSALDLSSEESLLSALAEEIRQALDLGGASTYRLPEWPGDDQEPGSLREWFRSSFMEVALAALRIRHLLLIFDDAHLLLDAEDRGALPDDELHYLEELLAAYDRLDLVFALDAGYENRVLGLELLNDPVLHFRLSELPRADAERLVREPVEGWLSYADSAVEQILALGGGHPFLLHSICRLLFRRSEERHHVGAITDNDLSAIHAAVLDQADEIFGPLWSSATPNERLTLTTLIQLDGLQPGQVISFEAIHNHLTSTGYAINKTQLAAALRGLDYDGLVHAEADRYTLPVRLVTDWVNANRPLASDEGSTQATSPNPARFIPVAGLLIVVLLVGILGIAVLGGFLGKNEDKPADAGAPTATLSLNLEATRRADFLTQTEHARPTETPTITLTPTATASPTASMTASATATASLTASPTTTETPTASATITSTPTLTETPTAAPRPTDTPVPTGTPHAPATNTPRPTPVSTLDPGA